MTDGDDIPAAPEAPIAELTERARRMRAAMAAQFIDCLVVTSRANFEYLTGHLSLTFAYQARPLFAVLTLDELVVMGSRAEARNIALRERPFRFVPYDGLQAEAARAVVDVVASLDPAGRWTVGLDWGQDMLGRGSLELLDGLRDRAGGARVVSAERAVWRTRMIKSAFEAELKRHSFTIVNAAFDEAIAAASEGISERALQRDLQARIILKGAERADPIAMTFGQGDFVYSRLPSDRRLAKGDYLWTDFRSTFGGYPADRNRIARCGEPEPWEVAAYETVRAVTIALCESIRPGEIGADVHRRFERLWSDAGLPPVYGAVSRIGHGGGLEVTEPPSIAPWSNEVIETGMVLHLEPKLERDGAVFQFEEIVWVLDDGVSFLSELSPAQCPVIPTRGALS